VRSPFPEPLIRQGRLGRTSGQADQHSGHSDAALDGWMMDEWVADLSEERNAGNPRVVTEASAPSGCEQDQSSPAFTCIAVKSRALHQRDWPPLESISMSLRPSWMPIHIWKQFKFIFTGLALIWFCDAIPNFANALTAPGWTRFTTLIASGLGALTIALLSYLIVVIPRRTGASPDYTQWQQSPDLSIIIPILTAAIPLCWSFLSWSLSGSSLLGGLQGTGGATGIMILGFGLMGLVSKP